MKTPRSLDWEAFSTLPRTRLVMDIHCVTRWSLLDTEWEGVSLRTLCDGGFLEILPTCTHVIQHAEFGFTANLPISIVRAENFLLATHYNDQPLSPEHGFPLRGIVGAIPGKTGIGNPLFLERRQVAAGIGIHKRGSAWFREQAGYHNDANVWREERTA